MKVRKSTEQTENTRGPQTETDDKIQFIGITQYKIYIIFWNSEVCKRYKMLSSSNQANRGIKTATNETTTREAH